MTTRPIARKTFNLTIDDVKRDWNKPPNLVSFVRLLLIVPTCVFLLQPSALGWAGFVLFVVAAATDKLDGMLAQRNNGRWTTKLGKTIDPFIDKALVLSAFITAAVRCDEQLRVAVIVVTVAIIGREVVVAIVKSKQPVKSAAQAGRFSMVVQSIAVAALLLPSVFDWQTELVKALLWIALGASLCSGWAYWAEWRSIRRTTQ